MLHTITCKVVWLGFTSVMGHGFVLCLICVNVAWLHVICLAHTAWNFRTFVQKLKKNPDTQNCDTDSDLLGRTETL